MRIRPMIAAAGAAALLAATGIDADPHDHDRARAALERGEIRPIAEILATAAAEVPGEVIEIELERTHGAWVYELEVIDPRGRMLEVLLDAATASLIAVEHEHGDDHRRKGGGD
jgi:uncharacterized membrane protein YkoI